MWSLSLAVRTGPRGFRAEDEVGVVASGRFDRRSPLTRRSADRRASSRPSGGRGQVVGDRPTDRRCRPCRWRRRRLRSGTVAGPWRRPFLIRSGACDAERMFRYPTIGSLSPEQSSDALTLPARDESVRWNDDAIVRVLEVTGGYPYFLQEFGKQAWDAADGPSEITLDDVEQSLPAATAELDDGFFRVRIGRTSDAERAYLRAMAECGPGAVRSSDVAQVLGRKITALGPVRDGLMKKALLFATVGRDRIHGADVRSVHEAVVAELPRLVRSAFIQLSLSVPNRTRLLAHLGPAICPAAPGTPETRWPRQRRIQLRSSRRQTLVSRRSKPQRA